MRRVLRVARGQRVSRAEGETTGRAGHPRDNFQGTYRGEVVERCGEALRLAGDLVHERNVLRDSQELLGALDGVKRHLGRGRRAPGHSRSALEAQASHGAGREGGSRSNSGERDQCAHHLLASYSRVIASDRQKLRSTWFCSG